jgi:transposase
MVLDDERPIAEVGRALGVNPGTLGNWVAQERIERGERDGLTVDERSELTDLRSEVTQLRMERDLLKRSLAFWVKETSTP